MKFLSSVPFQCAAGADTMLIAVLALVACACAQMIPDCRNVDDRVDAVLGASDYLMWLHSVTPQVVDFQQDFPVSLLWIPMTVSVEVVDGAVSSLKSLTRSGPAMECSTPNFRTLEANFNYDVLQADYVSMTVKFWRWELEGKFSYRVRPSVNLAIAQGPSECTLESFNFVKTDDVEYIIDIDESTWKGWLVGKMLRRALEKDGYTIPVESSIFKSMICTVVNDDVDEVLSASNEQMHTRGWQPCIRGFKQDIPVTIFGFTTPAYVSLSVYSGSLKVLETLTRSGNATECSSSFFDTLYGTLTYDSLELSYEYFQASFLSLEMEGKLSFVQTRADVYFVIANGTDDCSLQSFKVRNSDAGSYEFSVDLPTWQSWLLEKVLDHALIDQGTTLNVFEKQYQCFALNFKMLTWVVGFLCAFIALGASDDLQNCIVMNKVMDSVINSTNVQITESHDTYQEFAFFVQQDVDLFLLNVKLPFVASLYLTEGRMGKLDTLRRHGDIWNCSSSDLGSLNGVYKYDVLSISYNMNVTFLRWQVTGKFVYHTYPYIAIGIVKGTQNCNLEIYEMVDKDQGEYEITMEDSWMGWLVGKLLRHSLQGVENEEMLGNMLQTSTVNINEYLGENVCSTIWDSGNLP
ncbi:hypothetical protein GE061_011495 [Apolygus lucorum]|uniref:Uncharacterized protein n=1 Tax=Apolygus lucorum TaxID=248454 RepID=A0A6A4IUK9_APOLU|nr:hypothetical protein GE061_011495 [Apolygus lucorum]